MCDIQMEERGKALTEPRLVARPSGSGRRTCDKSAGDSNKALNELRRAISQRQPPELPAAKQTQSEDQPPEPIPRQMASDPPPHPERSEIQHPTTNIQHPSSLSYPDGALKP